MATPTSIETAIRRASSADDAALAVVGQATFLETFAGVLDGAAIVAHCREAHSAARYRQWLEQDVALWRDQPLSRLRALLQEDPYRPGAAALVRELRRRRLELAIVSSGPSIHAELVAEELGVPRVVANEVLVRDGLVTGEVGRCVPLHGKGLVVQGLLEAWGADPAQTLALGDSESDIAVFGLVGLAVAVCPQSPKVVQAADLSWDGQGLQPLLQALRDLDPALFP